jgi:hypothetical protein
MQSLFKLNNKLYNFYFHVPVLIILLLVLKFQSPFYVAAWINIGFAIWAMLLLFRLYQDKQLMPLKNKKDLLGYIVGFNICLVLGPLSVLLFLALKNYKK